MPDKKPISIPNHNNKYRCVPASLRSRMPDYVHNMGVAPETTVTAKAPLFPRSASARYNYNKAVGKSTAVHALKMQDPVFDFLAGRAGVKAATGGFNLAKSALKTTWWARNSKKILKSGLFLNQAKDLYDLENNKR